MQQKYGLTFALSWSIYYTKIAIFVEYPVFKRKGGAVANSSSPILEIPKGLVETTREAHEDRIRELSPRSLQISKAATDRISASSSTPCSSQSLIKKRGGSRIGTILKKGLHFSTPPTEARTPRSTVSSRSSSSISELSDIGRSPSFEPHQEVHSLLEKSDKSTQTPYGNPFENALLEVYTLYNNRAPDGEFYYLKCDYYPFLDSQGRLFWKEVPHPSETDLNYSKIAFLTILRSIQGSLELGFTRIRARSSQFDRTGGVEEKVSVTTKLPIFFETCLSKSSCAPALFSRFPDVELIAVEYHWKGLFESIYSDSFSKIAPLTRLEEKFIRLASILDENEVSDRIKHIREQLELYAGGLLLVRHKFRDFFTPKIQSVLLQKGYTTALFEMGRGKAQAIGRCENELATLVRDLMLGIFGRLNPELSLGLQERLKNCVKDKITNIQEFEELVNSTVYEITNLEREPTTSPRKKKGKGKRKPKT